MSYQMPPSGGPPRNTPIPGESTIIQGTGIPNVAPTPSAFLGTQGMATPPPVKQKKDRNWGFWFMALLIAIPAVLGIAAAVWGVLAAKDAVENANELSDPDLSDQERDALGLDDSEQSILLGSGPAATAAALDAGIPGEPTNFIEIILYPGYAFGTAQDPTRPERIDRYQWQSGSVGAPDPETNDPEAPSKVFTIDAVDWDAIAVLAADAPRVAAVDEGEVTHIIVNRNIFDESNDIIVRIYIHSDRGSAFIEATADGTFIRLL